MMFSTRHARLQLASSAESTATPRNHLRPGALMIRRLPLSALFMAVLSGCSGTTDTLAFNPEPGETRRYQLHTDSTISTGNRYAGSERVHSITLMDYQVSKSWNSVRVHLLPRLLMMKHGRGSFSSQQSPADNEREGVREMMAEGMTLTLNKRTGQVASLDINNPIEELQESGLLSLLEGPENNLNRPGFATGIALEEGATLALAGDESLPAITITVVRLDEEKATLQLRGENADSRLFGYMTVDRNSGWPLLGTIFLEQPIGEDGSNGTMRSVLSMLPADFPDEPMLQKFKIPSLPWEIDAFEPPGELDPIDEETVFPSDFGRINSYRISRIDSDGSGSTGGDWQGLRFEYSHNTENAAAIGRIALTDLQAIDSNGAPIDIDLHPLQSHTFYHYDAMQVVTETGVWPLGWQLSEEDLDSLAGAEATMSLYGQTQHILSVPLGNEATQVAHSGARAILRPGADESTYLLTLHPTPDAYFQHGLDIPLELDGPDSGLLDYTIDEDAPDWLNEAQGRYLQFSRQGRSSITLTLHFDETPQELRIPLILLDKEPRAQRRLTFYRSDILLDNANLPPPESMPLYMDREFEATELPELEPDTFDRAQLFLVLSRAQATLCEPFLAPDSPLTGNELHWRTYPRHFFGLRQDPGVIYQLSSHDGKQTYFYQQAVNVGLRCDGEPEWRQLALDLGERDWLIDLAELLGKNWQEQALSRQPLSDFLDRYRFFDKDGVVLAIVPPSSAAAALRIDNNSLLEFATGDGQLRIAGHVQRIEQLHVVGKPLERRWQHQFPALPGYDATLYPQPEQSQ